MGVAGVVLVTQGESARLEVYEPSTLLQEDLAMDRPGFYGREGGPFQSGQDSSDYQNPNGNYDIYDGVPSQPFSEHLRGYGYYAHSEEEEAPVELAQEGEDESELEEEAPEEELAGYTQTVRYNKALDRPGFYSREGGSFQKGQDSSDYQNPNGHYDIYDNVPNKPFSKRLGKYGFYAHMEKSEPAELADVDGSMLAAKKVDLPKSFKQAQKEATSSKGPVTEEWYSKGNLKLVAGKVKKHLEATKKILKGMKAKGPAHEAWEVDPKLVPKK